MGISNFRFFFFNIERKRYFPSWNRTHPPSADFWNGGVRVWASHFSSSSFINLSALWTRHPLIALLFLPSPRLQTSKSSLAHLILSCHVSTYFLRSNFLCLSFPRRNYCVASLTFMSYVTLLIIHLNSMFSALIHLAYYSQLLLNISWIIPIFCSGFYNGSIFPRCNSH